MKARGRGRNRSPGAWEQENQREFVVIFIDMVIYDFYDLSTVIYNNLSGDVIHL